MKILITTDWYKPVINGVVTSVTNLEEGLRGAGQEEESVAKARCPDERRGSASAALPPSFRLGVPSSFTRM